MGSHAIPRNLHRLAQTRRGDVLTYEVTLHAEALALVAAKTRASLMVEGVRPEEG